MPDWLSPVRSLTACNRSTLSGRVSQFGGMLGSIWSPMEFLGDRLVIPVRRARKGHYEQDGIASTALTRPKMLQFFVVCWSAGQRPLIIRWSVEAGRLFG